MKLQPINLQVNPDILDLPLINSKMAKVHPLRRQTPQMPAKWQESATKTVKKVRQKGD
jgi:hypothetical protein